MSARSSRFSGFGSRSGRGKAAAAVIACGVMLLAGCGGSGGSASDADAPVVRGDLGDSSASATTTASATPSATASVTATSTPSASPTVSSTPTASASASATSELVVVFTPTTATFDKPVTMTTKGGSSTGPTTYTSANCDVTESTLTRWMAGYCWVTVTQGTQTAKGVFTFTGAPTVTDGNKTVTFMSNYDGTGRGGASTTQKASTPTALQAHWWDHQGYTFAGWATSSKGTVAYADMAPYPFAESATLYATWKWFCIRVNLTVSAKRTGAGSANVTFSASDFYPYWTSFVAFAAKDGGQGATLNTQSPDGTITVTGLNKKNGYTFDVTAKNEAGCSYKATTNRITKWGIN